ncbi:MAG: glycoside hydrolase family 97 protein [Rikenellaceae bacterium]
MKRILIIFLLTISTHTWAARYQLKSPNGHLVVDVVVDDSGVKYTLSDRGDMLLEESKLSMTLYDGELLGGPGAKVSTKKSRSVDKILDSPLYIKSQVKEAYNELVLNFKGDYSVVFRAYDEGVAYRFRLNRRGEVIIKDEQVEYNFSDDPIVYASYTRSKSKQLKDQVRASHENVYIKAPLSEQNTDKLVLTPMGVDRAGGRKIVITESDLRGYPGIYMLPQSGGFRSYFAVCPKVTKQGGWKNVQTVVVESNDYIAKSSGKRDFPWRVMVVANQDSELLSNDLVYLLAEPSCIGDTSWVKPGMVAWEWWHNLNITGVDFKVGVNNATYKYYVDFAQEYGIRYIILDEGWSKTQSGDLMQVVPDIDIKEIVDYANSKGVDVILWTGQYAVSGDSEHIVKYYADLGVKGFKVDFCSRDDQLMVEFVSNFSELCAKYRMVVDFHGICKPAGINRTYPNIVNFEGVAGLEYMKLMSQDELDMVKHDLDIPFFRMLSGPIDYTQGAMKNSVKGDHHKSFNNPMSQGTRARQAAMYVVYFSPLCMLCDSPSSYRMEPDFTKVITSVPVVWDDTRALQSIVGEKVAVARRKGDDWYIGAMNEWETHTFDIPLDFLEDGDYLLELVCDGVNADRVATDYKIKEMKVSKGSHLVVECAPGGGFLAKLKKQ